MGLVITSLILSILTILGVLACIIIYNNENNSNVKRKWCILGLLWLLIIPFGCFTTIRANQVGIIYNPFKNGIQNEVLGEGFRTKTPFDKVYKISTEVEEFTFKDISVQTNDAQYVTAIMQVQINIDKEMAFDYFKKYGNKQIKDIQNILSSSVQKKLEEVTTTYNVMNLLGENRNEIVDKTYELLSEELLKDGICIRRIVLVDTDAGEAIEQSIANEAVAKKQAETAEYNKQKAQLEGEAKVIEAEKEKEANELKQKALTQEILTEKMIEKWNGQLPTTVLNDNILSVFDTNK